MSVVRTDSEIEDVRNAALDVSMTQGTKFPGMSYEEGVSETISWLVGDSDTAPMEDED